MVTRQPHFHKWPKCLVIHLLLTSKDFSWFFLNAMQKCCFIPATVNSSDLALSLTMEKKKVSLLNLHPGLGSMLELAPHFGETPDFNCGGSISSRRGEGSMSSRRVGGAFHLEWVGSGEGGGEVGLLV